MRRKQSGYPLEATWQAQTPDGTTGTVYLASVIDRLNPYFEVWRWSVKYKDGSSGRLMADQCYTKKSAFDEARGCLSFHGNNRNFRFKRIE